MIGTLRVRWLFTLLPRTVNYLFNQSVPWLYKLILLLPVLWYFTPMAHLANAVPVLGLLDELAILLVTLALFTTLASHHLQKQVRHEVASGIEFGLGNDSFEKPNMNARPIEIIEGEYYVIDRSQVQPQVFKKAS